MSTQTIINVILISFLIGGGLFVYWFINSEMKDRRKHYRIAITIKQNGKIGVYESKWISLDRRPIVVVPAQDTPLAEIDINLGSGKAKVIDTRGEVIT